MNRVNRERAVDAVLTYWLNGAADNEDLAEWWTTDEAGDCAAELVGIIEAELLRSDDV